MRRYPEALVAPSRRRATARSLLPAWLSRWVRPLATHARTTRIPKQDVMAVVERVLVRLPGGR
jgi:hypothetical protein